MASVPLEKKDFARVWAFGLSEAYNAGLAAQPVPMIVGEPTHPLGNDIDPTKPIYIVNEGLCGFAWVNVKPGTSSFAKWLVKMGHATSDPYYGGVTIWCGDFNQSWTRKKAWASTLAAYLRRYGINAHMGERLD